MNSIDLGSIRGFGNIGLEGKCAVTAPTVLETVLSTAIGVMSIVGFIWFIFQFISGALAIVSAGGDKGKLEEARNRMTTGIIGVVVIVAAIFFIDLFGKILGINSILNPALFILERATSVSAC